MQIKYIIVIILFFYLKLSVAQNKVEKLQQFLSFKEYLGYVKKHHPIIKQANLQLSIGEANLLKSRGGFDPKIEIDYDRKKFKNTEYFNQLNTTFKIPTWYGIEFKVNYEENSGVYLNPNLTVPNGGLYSAGVSFSLAQGLLINERMAMLKKAKIFIKQSKAKRELLVNNLIFDASVAYFKWLEAHKELAIYKRFLSNAQIRYNGVKRNVEVGEKAAIDSIEAKITLQNRKLNLEVAKLKTRKAILKASNYLWLSNVPLEIQEYVYPLLPNDQVLSTSLVLEETISQKELLVNHPKLKGLEAKIARLSVDRSLKRNKLLPKLDLQYNFLASDIGQFNNFKSMNYKGFVNFSFPLFLRKERGALKLTNLKLQEASFQLTSNSLSIQNKINAIKAEINSLGRQNNLIKRIVSDYKIMFNAEERKFQLGESSLFLINSREQKLITSELKANILEIKSLNSRAKLYKAFGLSNLN
ncbi:TolC family protein [uncultured Tenacibaculum sp.]|uniref:TolC family protein n=1 Tax=uncultured Tenacibaculum sp. TaxID=174713 RepID=UPI00261CC13E|nr:TolC family protein [uncultured Tenacibaculum sp.]